MPSQSKQLADQFSRANDELIAVVDRCSDAQWRSVCPAEGWTVGVTAHHVADDYAALMEVIEALAAGRSVPAWTRELLDQRNAAHAERFARCTKHDTLTLLRRNGSALAHIICGLSDEQLTRTARVPDQEVSIADIAGRLLPGHIRGHLASIRTQLEEIAR
ncbi:MAG: maleylpyruvate isomerase N-terminal domain-containing protein [Dehalococcoidia bacterium]